MRFYKYLPVVVSLSLLASCGGGGGSSDSSAPSTSTAVADTPIVDTPVVDTPVVDTPIVDTPETVIDTTASDNSLEIVLNNSVVSEVPTEFFTLATRIDFARSFEEPISFDDFFGTVFEEVLLTAGNTTTSYDYNVDNNLEKESTIDASGSITTENTYNYTFNNDGRVINRESIRELFNDETTILSVTSNIEWADDNPVSLNTVSETPSPVVGEAPIITESNFTYQVDAFTRQLLSTTLVEGEESTVIGDSLFFVENTENVLTSNEVVSILRDSETNEVIRERSFFYDTDVFIGDNVIVLIEERRRNGAILTNDINFYIHFGDVNETLLVTFDNIEFNNGLISNSDLNNGTITSFEMSRFTYERANNCGNYEEMATIAFNILAPTCITNLTFSN